jgi:hypothetical protein
MIARARRHKGTEDPDLSGLSLALQQKTEVRRQKTEDRRRRTERISNIEIEQGILN